MGARASWVLLEEVEMRVQVSLTAECSRQHHRRLGSVSNRQTVRRWSVDPEVVRGGGVVGGRPGVVVDAGERRGARVTI